MSDWEHTNNTQILFQSRDLLFRANKNGVGWGGGI